jgi:hypothetical protein
MHGKQNIKFSDKKKIEIPIYSKTYVKVLIPICKKTCENRGCWSQKDDWRCPYLLSYINELADLRLTL